MAIPGTKGSERRRFYSSKQVPLRASATASAPAKGGWYSKFVLWLHKVMDMGRESYSETIDREDGFIGVLVGQGNSRRGADHDVPGDKRGLQMLEIWSETYSKNRSSREVSTVESLCCDTLTVADHLDPAEMRLIGHAGASRYRTRKSRGNSSYAHSWPKSAGPPASPLRSYITLEHLPPSRPQTARLRRSTGEVETCSE